MSLAIYCDHCGQPIAGRREWSRCHVSLPVLSTDFDLCKPCIDELLAFIGHRNQYTTSSTNQETDE